MEAAAILSSGNLAERRCAPFLQKLGRIHMRFQPVFLLSILALASGCSYRSGSLLETPDSPTRIARQRGCADVAVTLADDARVTKPSALVVYSFGNRCDHSETFDLARAVVTGVTAEGTSIELAPNDPSGRVHPELLEADAEGKELVRYDVPKHEGKTVSDVEAFEKICVDLRRVVESAEGTPVVCLTPPGDPKALLKEEMQQRPLDATSFGYGWSVVPFPRMKFDVGVSGYSMGTQDTRLYSPRVGGVNARDAFGTSRVGGATFDLRISGFLTERVYVGGELSAGGGPSPGGVVHSTVEEGPIGVEQTNFQIQSGAFVGVTIDRIGPLQPRFELFGGGRIVLAHARTEDCSGSACRNLVGFQGVVMPRVAADFWLNPFMTLGPWAGIDLVNQGDFAAGLVFSLHGRAYDGRR